MKIIDKINKKIANGQIFFSFEFFPPRTEEGVENLFERLHRMAAFDPMFCDITWGAGGTTADLTLDIAVKMQNEVCVETMMHLTCTNMPVEKLQSALNEVKKKGLQNILALRGDPPKGQEKFEAIEGGFKCGLDLVRHIRKEFGDYFGICVAGYPEAHPDKIVEDPTEMEKNYWDDIRYLKEKVDAGADFIITQLFYDVDRFIKFVQDCSHAGINVPILPGVMPIMTYGGFKRMTGFCKTYVPQDILDTVESIKDNEEAVRNYGIELGASMCRRLLDAGVPGLHMYSLNLERSVLGILERLGVVDTTKVPRRLPWRHVPMGTRRSVEGVRPIFWSKRPKSYLKRTAEWKSFPRGRWVDSDNPAYGALEDPEFMRHHTASSSRKQKALNAWGLELKSFNDVKDVFVKYYQGDIGVLPWADAEFNPTEGFSLRTQLVDLSQRGFLVINAQPALNAVPSSDPHLGWGEPNGYVYQKAYAEFFVRAEQLPTLLEAFQQSPSLTYLAVNAAGDLKTNADFKNVNAVAWGVFPGKEVVQPTVVDPNSFMVWKDEAFELWTAEWGNAYDDGSSSRQVLADVKSSAYLVSVVDNDYIHGDLFALLAKL